MELSQEQLDKAIQDAVDAATTGLVNKNNELIGELRSGRDKYNEQIGTAEQELTDARAAAVKAEEDRLKLAGDVDGLKSHYETQLAETTATANQARELAEERLNKIHKDRAVNEILNHVDDRFKPFVKTQLASSTKISYNEQGEAVTTITDNGINYSSVEDFFNGVKDSDTWKSVLKGVDSSGAGTTNSNGSGAPTVNTVQSNLSQRLKSHGLT